MPFRQSNFHNMRRDDMMVVARRDIDLVIERFEKNKSQNDSFFYLVKRHEIGIPIGNLV